MTVVGAAAGTVEAGAEVSGLELLGVLESGVEEDGADVSGVELLGGVVGAASAMPEPSTTAAATTAAPMPE
ncbi:MAG: hypothetical protein KGR47_10965 [Acidobacteria bacterium]|nr:hypothetical protein [Acidobacteriota bacterium]